MVDRDDMADAGLRITSYNDMNRPAVLKPQYQHTGIWYVFRIVCDNFTLNYHPPDRIGRYFALEHPFDRVPGKTYGFTIHVAFTSM